MSRIGLTAGIELSDIIIDISFGSVSVKMHADMRGYEEEVDEVPGVDPEEAMSLTVGEIVSRAWKAHRGASARFLLRDAPRQVSDESCHQAWMFMANGRGSIHCTGVDLAGFRSW